MSTLTRFQPFGAYRKHPGQDHQWVRLRDDYRQTSYAPATRHKVSQCRLCGIEKVGRRV